ncbi:MAG: hypothetical protein WC866_00035 [Patescibacteria group bacterium]|jgi:hypothetical protein
MSFRKLFSDAIVNWPWTDSAYPSLDGASARELDRFARHHVLLHALKSLGGLAAIEEALDHGKKLHHGTRRKFKTLAAKMIINGFQLAHLAGLDADGLAREIRAVIAAGLKDR